MMDEDLAGLVKDDTREKMAKAIDHVRHEMGNVRTGRASPALVETLVVDYYGTPTPLRQLAGFSVPDAMLLVISPYDKGSLGAIEKAIQTSDLGINPTNDGTVIRLAFPPLTEERRKDLVKVVRHKAEEGRVAMRNLRRAGAPRARGTAEGRRALDRRARAGGEGAREDHPGPGGARSTSCSAPKSKSSSRSEQHARRHRRRRSARRAASSRRSSSQRAEPEGSRRSPPAITPGVCASSAPSRPATACATVTGPVDDGAPDLRTGTTRRPARSRPSSTAAPARSRRWLRPPGARRTTTGRPRRSLRALHAVRRPPRRGCAPQRGARRGRRRAGPWHFESDDTPGDRAPTRAPDPRRRRLAPGPESGGCHAASTGRPLEPERYRPPARPRVAPTTGEPGDGRDARRLAAAAGRRAAAARPRPAARPRRNGAGARTTSPGSADPAVSRTRRRPRARPGPVAATCGWPSGPACSSGVVALVCFAAGTVASMVIVTLVVLLAAAEAYAAFRRAQLPPGHAARPGGLLLADRSRPTTRAWRRCRWSSCCSWPARSSGTWPGSSRRPTRCRGMTATVFVFVWVGVFGSFAACC